MLRYVVLIWNAEDNDSGRRAVSIEASLKGEHFWRAAYRNNGVTVMLQRQRQQGNSIYLLENGHGIILGSLFSRKSHAASQAASASIDALEAQRIVDSAGRHLIERYWGSYVAVFEDEKPFTWSILRDPTANVACFRAKCGNVNVFFSHAEDVKRHLTPPISINWPSVASHMLTGGHLTRECGLREIDDIPGGECVTLSKDSERRATLWHPAQFCRELGLEDEDRARLELRSSVLNVVQMLASEHTDVMVRLSGGLDSSIVASCLAEQNAARNVTCLNFYVATDRNEDIAAPLTPGLSKEDVAKVKRIIGGADEREFARSVAGKCGFRLLENEKRARDLDLREVWNAPLATRPSYYIFVFDEDRAETECARAVGATACFTGEGGDTVFYNTLRAIAALDYAYLHPLGSRLLHHIARTAHLSGESFARVVTKVIKHGYLHLPLPEPIDPTALPHLLRDEVARSVAEVGLHNPWEDMVARLCPGKRNHVSGVALTVPTYHRAYHRESVAASLHPLSSQPVVEACLRTPTYVLLADGLPRGLARRAFRDLLPTKVSRRVSKGVAVSWCKQIVCHNLAYLRECLLDGVLVKERLLDRAKLEPYLVENQPFLTVQPQQLLGYLASETWVNQWIGK